MKLGHLKNLNSYSRTAEQKQALFVSSGQSEYTNENFDVGIFWKMDLLSALTSKNIHYLFIFFDTNCYFNPQSIVTLTFSFLQKHNTL